MSSQLKVYKGPENKMDQVDIEDGQLFFATDSKTIYLDCDFTNGNNEKVYGRFPYGGGNGNGILFASKPFDETANEYFFTKNDMDSQPGEIVKLPQLNNVLYNLEDGFFYRIINVFEDKVEGERLNASGIGGGGGVTSGIKATMITPYYVYTDSSATSIPLTIAARSYTENAILSGSLHIGNQEFDLGEIPQSFDNITNLYTVDLIDYKDFLMLNGPNTVSMSLRDNANATTKVPLTWKVYIYTMSLDIVTNENNMGTQYKEFSFEILPFVPSGLSNPELHYEVVLKSQNSITYTQVKKLDVDSNATVSVKVASNALRAPGSYKVNMWISAQLTSNSEIKTIVTGVKTFNFIYQIAGAEQAILDVNFPAGGEYLLYDSGIELQYRLSYNKSMYIRRSLIIDGIPEVYSNELIEPDIWYAWPNLNLVITGQYVFQLELLDTNGSVLQTITNPDPFIVKSSADSDDSLVPALTSSNLLINLTPDKTNASIDRDQWISKTSEGGEYICHLENFNWNSNGWEIEKFINESNEQKTISVLHLNNGAKAILDYNPWAPSDFNKNYGAEGKGITIEFDVKIDNIKNKYKHLITCASQKKGEDNNYILYSGLIVNGEAFTLNSRKKYPIKEVENPQIRFTDKTKSGLVAYYKEGERIHVSYVITPREVNSSVSSMIPSRIVYTYINGVISGITNYDAQDAFLQNGTAQDSVPQLVFDSSDADIYIYNFRVYNSVLYSQDILRNYLATIGDLQTSAQKWSKNNILENSNISFAKFKASNPNISYLVIRGGQKCVENEDTGGYDAVPNGIIGLPTDEDDFRLIDAYFVDIDNEENNIGTIERDKNGDISKITNRAKMIMYPQGTSSLVYPVKNLRIEFIDGQKYSLMGLPAVDLFTLKADYMESSGSHNTGAANALNALYEGVNLKTPAQERDSKYVTAIKGKPIVVFYKELSADKLNDNTSDKDSEYIFIGKYNFNLDKKTPEPFGFFSDPESKYGVVLDEEQNIKSGFIAANGKNYDENRNYYTAPNFDSKWDINKSVDWKTYVQTIGPLYEYHDASKDEYVNSIQCWEVATNTSKLVRFQNNWEEIPYIRKDIYMSQGHTEEEWNSYEDIRKKNMQDWLDSFESRYPKYKEEQCADKRGLVRLINWLASTNLINPTNELLKDGMDQSLLDPNTQLQTHYGYTHDTKEYRNTKFKEEAKNYLNIDFMAFYYIITEVNFMIDSRAKNMMLCSFDQDMDANTGHWFPIFYDLDTQLGIDNEGKLRFLYDDEDYEQGKFNALADYTNLLTGEDNNTLPSILWANFKNNFQPEIKNMYAKLRNTLLTPNSLISMYNDNQADAWEEVFCNQDAQYKYLRPFLNNEMSEEFEKFDENGNSLNAAKANRLYAAQGTRSVHRSKYIKNRIDYLDTKYQYTTGIPYFQFRLQGPNSTKKAETTPEQRGTFNITARNSFYLNYKQELTDPIKFKHRFEENETYDIYLEEYGDMAQEQSLYLYSSDAYINLGDISLKYPSSFTLEGSSESKLLELQLSPKDLDRKYYNEFTTDASKLAELGIVSDSPLIEKLWTRNMIYNSTLDLTKNHYLQEFYGGGTGFSGVQFPDGGVLKYVELPTTVSSIDIKGHGELKDLNILTYRDQANEKYPENSVNYTQVTEFSIERCPKLDTKTLFNSMTSDILSINLPDINWTLTLDECQIGVPLTDENGEIVMDEEIQNPIIVEPNIIYKIPIIDKLVNTPQVNGNADDIYKLNRNYVKGTITIENDNTDIGLDEVLMYNNYQQYYPYLNIQTSNNINDIKGYSFNVYSSASEILTEYSVKYKAHELLTKFTLDNTFGQGENNIKILPQNLNLLPQYNTHFVGWNLTARQEFREDDYKLDSIQANIDEAYKEANEVVVIKYDENTNSYRVNNNFDFTTAFADTQVLNFYPTFVATVAEYDVIFYDGLTDDNGGYGNIIPVEINSVIQTSQKVRYNNTAVMPAIIPQKLDLLANDVKETRIYEFMNYNQRFTNDNPPVITGATQLKAYYKNTYVHIRTIPSSESYFELTPGGSNGVYIKIVDGCNQPALTIPNTYKGNQVIGLMPSTNTVRRIYCMDGNTISVIGDDFKKEDAQFEYFDFAYLQNNNISIGARAFQNCEMLQSDVLPDPMGMIDIKTSAFDGCKKLSISYLPSQLMALENYVFRKCSGITNFSFNHSPNLIKIGVDCFRECTNLQLIDNSLNNLSIISDRAFRDCPALNAIIDNTSKITEVGGSAFEKSSVTLNALPDNLRKIQDDGFAFIASPKTCQIGFIPNTITKIGKRAFSGLTFDVDEVVFEDGITLVKPVDDPDAKDIDYGMEATAFSGAYIKAIRLPNDAITTEEPWATGLATSWEATTNGNTPTPIITN